MRVRLIGLSLAVAMGVTGCKTTNENVGAVLGGIGGAAASFGITTALGGDSTTAAIASAAGGLAGAYIGGEIGRRLDEADRQKAQAASAKAVTDGSTGQTVQWQSDKNPNVSGHSKVVDTGRISNKPEGEPTVTWQRSRTREPIKPAAPAAAPPPVASKPAASQPAASRPAASRPAAAPPAQQTPASTQTAASEPADDRLCKRIDEVAYINGKEVRQQRVFCQTASGGWAPMAA